MALTINQHNGTYNRSRRSASIRYIVQHYTGGTGSARNNCIYFAGGNRNASADFFIDKDGAVWQYNGDIRNYYTWAVGDGRGRYGITNANSVSIEYVSNGEDFTAAQIKSGAELTKKLMADYGVPADRVVRHYDASRKECPLPYVNGTKWKTLHAQLTGGASVPSTPAPSKPALANPGTLEVDGWWGSGTTTKLQQVFGTPVDGVVSHQWAPNRQQGTTSGWQWDRTQTGSTLIRAMQRWLGVSADGLFGKETIKALQRKMGTPVDGVLSPRSSCIKEMQRRLNAGTLK